MDSQKLKERQEACDLATTEFNRVKRAKLSVYPVVPGKDIIGNRERTNRASAAASRAKIMCYSRELEHRIDRLETERNHLRATTQITTRRLEKLGIRNAMLKKAVRSVWELKDAKTCAYLVDSNILYVLSEDRNRTDRQQEQKQQLGAKRPRRETTEKTSSPIVHRVHHDYNHHHFSSQNTNTTTHIQEQQVGAKRRKRETTTIAHPHHDYHCFSQNSNDGTTQQTVHIPTHIQPSYYYYNHATQNAGPPAIAVNIEQPSVMRRSSLTDNSPLPRLLKPTYGSALPEQLATVRRTSSPEEESTSTTIPGSSVTVNANPHHLSVPVPASTAIHPMHQSQHHLYKYAIPHPQYQDYQYQYSSIASTTTAAAPPPENSNNHGVRLAPLVKLNYPS